MNDKNQTRAVPLLHAERALYVAIERMYAVLREAAKNDPESTDKIQMLLEAGQMAGSVALEIASQIELGTGAERPPEYAGCYRDWAAWITGTGPSLTVAGSEELRPHLRSVQA